jgi:hypothetical protein
MNELRISVCYPMPLNLALDQEIKTYAEHYGFTFLGSGTDGYSRDLEFQGSTEHLERESLLLLLSRLLQESIIIKMYRVEMMSPNDIKDG